MEKPKLSVAETDSVPAFTCLIYIRQEAGQVAGCVANLEGIEAVGASEREVLGKIVPAFKQRVAGLIRENKPIPWIESPRLPDADQQKRIVPVHL